MSQEEKLSLETVAAVSMILLWSIFLVSYFLLGFVFPLYIIVAFSTLFLAAVHPKSALYVIIFLTVLFERFFALNPIVTGESIIKLYPIDVLFLGIFAGIGIATLLKRGGVVSKNALIPLFFFTALVTLFAFIGAGALGTDNATIFSTWKNYIFYGSLTVLIPIFLKTRSDLKKLLQYFLIAATGAASFIFIGAVRGEGLWTEYTPLSTEGFRILAFPHAFYLSLAVIIVIALLPALFTRVQKHFFFWILPIWLIGIAGSLMRHLWLAGIISFGFLLAMSYRSGGVLWQKTYLRYGVIILLIVGSIGYMSLLFPMSDVAMQSSQIGIALTERISSVTNTYDESTSWRFVVWGQAFEQLRENYFFGTGLGGRVAVQIREYHDFVEIRNIHNSLLALFVQTGIIGIGFFGWIIWNAVKGILKSALYDSGVDGSVSRALLVVLIFQSVAFLFQPYLETNLLGIFFWATLGVMFSWRRLISKESRTV